MKVVILLAAIFCCTIYSTSGEDCEDVVYKPCDKHCNEVMTGEAFEKGTKYCCPISRCVYCFQDIGLDKCGRQVENRLRLGLAILTEWWKLQGCKESEKYPSTKCLYYFYPAWFYVISLLIIAVIGGVVVFIVRRRRTTLRYREFIR